MRLCEEKVKSGGSQGKVRKIGSDLLFANVRIRFAIRTYGPYPRRYPFEKITYSGAVTLFDLQAQRYKIMWNFNNHIKVIR